MAKRKSEGSTNARRMTAAIVATASSERTRTRAGLIRSRCISRGNFARHHAANPLILADEACRPRLAHGVRTNLLIGAWGSVAHPELGRMADTIARCAGKLELRRFQEHSAIIA